MRILFDGRLSVDYWQGYLDSHEDHWEVDAEGAPTGGLIDASAPGKLTLHTGLKIGDVPLRIVLHDAEPPVGPEWEHVVEVPFRPATEELALRSWDGPPEPFGRVPITDYRARYSGRGVDAARDAQALLEGEEPIDHFELALWPSPPALAEVVREPERLHGPVQGRSAKADAAIAAAERVSRSARDGEPRSGELATVELEATLPTGRTLGDDYVTGLTWTGGDSMESPGERPGESILVAGFGYGDLDMEIRRLEPGRLVEVAWDLQVGWPTEVVETGAWLRVSVGGDVLRLWHHVPVEWAADLRLVWDGQLEKLVQRLGDDPWQHEPWSIEQDRGYPEPEPWDPRDDDLFIDEHGHEMGWREAEARQAADELAAWGGRPPTTAQREAYPYVARFGLPLAQLDRALVDAVFALSGTRQRELALLATRLAWERAGIDSWPGASAAFERVARGQRPDPPYAEADTLWPLVDATHEHPGEGATMVTVVGSLTAVDDLRPFPMDGVHGPSYAAPMLPDLLDKDPVHAAIDSLTGAIDIHGPADYRLVLRAVHAAFPELA